MSSDELINDDPVPPRLPQNPPTSYLAAVLHSLSQMTQTEGRIDQRKLRHCIGLASSFLVTDTVMSPDKGFSTWSRGLNILVDTMVALYARDELELETVSQASKACSECWSVASSWRGLDEAKETIRSIANKLKKVLDTNGKTYKGEPVYAP